MPGHQHDLRHVVDVPHRDEVFEPEEASAVGNRQRHAPSRTRSRWRPATKYGGKIVACQPGRSDTAKSKLTIVCTESTSGVERPASSR